MFYEIQAKTHIRVAPNLFGENTKQAVLEALNKEYEGYISSEVGFVICVTNIEKIGEGVIVAGDGAAFYETEFKLLSYLPEMQEIVLGKIRDITNFGAFINIGPNDGMIHVSQTMDDFISFSKNKTLVGKESKNVLKVGDKCKARIIAVSYKELNNPKIGLTMRQPYLGNLKWIEEETKKALAKKEGKEPAAKETKKKKEKDD